MTTHELPSAASERPTDGDSIGRVAADHDRLRYVTRLLGSPQGLNTALIGTLLFLLNAGQVVHLNGWWRVLAGLAWLAFLVGLLGNYREDWIPKYYERRFGSVEAQAPSSKWFALFCLALLVLLFIGWPIAHYLDPVGSSFLGQLHMKMSDPDRQINLLPSIMWMMLLCSSLRWRKLKIERHRLYFALVGMVGFGSIVSYAVWYPDAKQLVLWKILNAGGFGLTLIAEGLYDHFSLVLLLPERVAEGDDE